jgi:hypothetical protein
MKAPVSGGEGMRKRGRRLSAPGVLLAGACLVAVGFPWGGGLWAAEGVPGSPTGVRPLLIGSEVPSVDVLRPDGSPLDLREEAAKQPTVLIFYRGGW